MKPSCLKNLLRTIEPGQGIYLNPAVVGHPNRPWIYFTQDLVCLRRIGETMDVPSY